MTEKEVVSYFRKYIDFCERDGMGVPSREPYDLAISALEEIQNYQALGTVEELSKIKEDYAEAISEWRQYRKIGTVEELREAREKQRAKKPKYTKIQYGKHRWKRKPNGEIDTFAWENDYHNGVVCEVCGVGYCVLCTPNYDTFEDCEDEYYNCPSCGAKFYSKKKYCDCGQKLDFSGVEE